MQAFNLDCPNVTFDVNFCLTHSLTLSLRLCDFAGITPAEGQSRREKRRPDGTSDRRVCPWRTNELKNSF